MKGAPAVPFVVEIEAVSPKTRRSTVPEFKAQWFLTDYISAGCVIAFLGLILLEAVRLL